MNNRKKPQCSALYCALFEHYAVRTYAYVRCVIADTAKRSIRIAKELN